MRNHRILVLGLIVVFLMLLPGCKVIVEYDITGTWDLTSIIMGLEGTVSVTFTGLTYTGVMTLYDRPGTYDIDGKNVIFKLHWWDREWGILNEIFSGQFDDEDHMSGTVTYEFLDDGTTATGTWQATRQSVPVAAFR